MAVLTHRRPKGLDRLLSSFDTLTRPDCGRLAILVVDNDLNESARDVSLARRTGFAKIHYVCEPRRGIPVARNRALDEAQAMGADVLCFIDDDEYPDSQWLTNLVDCWKKTEAHLIGGPVEVTPLSDRAGTWARFVNASLVGRMRRKNRRTARAAECGRPFTVVTNNWLCDLGWQRRNGVRFDEKLLFSGGSDTAFHRDVKAAGGRIAWCPTARVHETMAPCRLSFPYQFRRAAAQSITNFRIKNRKVSSTVVLRTVTIASVRVVLGVMLVLVPVFGIASPVVAIRSLGWSTGRIQALLGRESELYKWSEGGHGSSETFVDLAASEAPRCEG
ncbi:glycosyltransferase [Oricola sp.]|uniref:glycosyltransferase family 2 protein n=1 Tax=Oricola sp. TaxID=1979950 RepID=UPI0025E69254|nr:glycosyltransferase [Oricola sp.]